MSNSGYLRELPVFSLDKSLVETRIYLNRRDWNPRIGGGMSRVRNVLRRPERLALLQEDGKWSADKGVYNVPKTKYRKLAPGQSGPKRDA